MLKAHEDNVIKIIEEKEKEIVAYGILVALVLKANVIKYVASDVEEHDEEKEVFNLEGETVDYYSNNFPNKFYKKPDPEMSKAKVLLESAPF